MGYFDMEVVDQRFLSGMLGNLVGQGLEKLGTEYAYSVKYKELSVRTVF